MIPGKCWLGRGSSGQTLTCRGDGQKWCGQTAGQAKPHSEAGGEEKSGNRDANGWVEVSVLCEHQILQLDGWKDR